VPPCRARFGKHLSPTRQQWTSLARFEVALFSCLIAR
jgi:hypothetical protein